MGLRALVVVAALGVAVVGCGSSHSSASSGQRVSEENFCAQLEATERSGAGASSISALMVGVSASDTPWSGAWQQFVDQYEVGNGDAGWQRLVGVIGPPCRSLGYPI